VNNLLTMMIVSEPEQPDKRIHFWERCSYHFYC